MANPVEKIYSLKTLGYDEIIAELDAISRKFTDIKKAKQEAAKVSADAARSQGTESQAYKDAAKALDAVIIKELELKKAYKEKANEAKANQLARQEEVNQQKESAAAAKLEAEAARQAAQDKKGLRSIEMAEAREIAAINKEVARQEALAMAAKKQAAANDEKELKRLIAEEERQRKKAASDEKELNRLIAEDEKKKNKEKEQSDKEYAAMYSRLLDERERKEKESAQAQIGSIAAIRKELSELNQAVIAVTPGSPVQFRGNTLGYDEAITKLKQLLATEQEFRRQFQKDATLVGEYTTGIIQAFKKMGIDDLVTGQVTKSNSALQQLNQEFEVLKRELRTVQESGNGSLENLEKQLIDNRNAAGLLEKEVGRLKYELRGTGDIGNQITTGLANGFKAMKGQLAQLVLSYVGFQAAFQGITAGIDTARELSDATTNLEIELGKTAGGADKLVASLAKLNTRTKLTELESIANIAAKAGVSEENLLGVTEALDKIKIAFGSDFGNVEEGTESLVKLINVFEGTGAVTGENLLKTGNAVRTLANETVASVPFLNDFAKRMSGLKGISDISLPAVLGLASGFEQFGQSSEVAGTALTKVIPKLATDTAKYAKIAGMTQQAFSDLLKSNPAEALIRVSESLVKSKNGIEEVSTAFADSQLGSGRIAAILGTVGAKADDFRKAIASAGEAYQNTGNIEDAFAKKNENLASVLDKISKAFADASNSEAFKATLTGISQVVLTLIQLITAIPFGIILGGLGLITAAWAFYKGNLIAATLAQSANNQATLLGSVRLGIMRSGLVGTAAAEKAAAIISQNAAATKIAALETQVIAERELLLAIQSRVVAEGEETLLLQADIAARRAKIIGIEAEIAATRTATVATEGLNVATKASPLGIILTLLAIALPALTAFGRSNEDAASKVDKLNGQLRIQGDIEAGMREQTTKTKNSVNELISIIKTEVTNQNLRHKAYQELIKIAPEFRDTLDGEYRATAKLNDVYDKYIIQLDRVARAQAIRNVKQKIENDKAEAQNKEFVAKIAADEEAQQNKSTEAANKAIAVGGLSSNSLGGAGAAFAQIKKVQTEKAKAYEQAKEEAKKANKAALDFDAFMKNANEDDRKALIEGIGGNTSTPAEVKNFSDLGVPELQEMLKGVKNQIAQIDKIRNQTAEQISKLKELRKLRNEINARIKELGGDPNPKKAKASALTAEDKDALAQEDARRDFLLAQENKDRAQNLEDEETYLKNVLRINQESIDRKLTLIKGESIAEKKVRAELTLKRITDEQETNKKLFDIKQTELRNQLDIEIATIKTENAIFQEDPSKSAAERAQFKLDSDNKMLEEYKEYNVKVDGLEKQLAQQTSRNSREIVKAQQNTTDEIIKDRRAQEEARLEDIRQEGQIEIDAQNAKYDEIRNSILRNERLTVEQKNALIRRLTSANNVTILTKELETLKAEFTRITGLYARNLKSEADYIKAKAALKKKEAELNQAVVEAANPKPQNLEEAATAGISDLFKLTKGGPEEQAVGKAVAESFNLATDAMHSYYDAERQRIQDSLELNLQRLDAEKEQVKARATSQAEMDNIDKQFEAKKKAAQKKAGEELKKSKKSEARIALATELANIWASVWQLGPIVAPIMGGVMSLLALGRYGLRVSQIDAEKFEEGGTLPKRGGRIKGRSHAQGGVKFNYDYEAEGEEIKIIRTKNAPARNKIFQIAGTFDQIASQINVIGGGVAFAPGATLKKFAMGGQIGANLQAPVFRQASNNTVINNNSNDAAVIEELRLLRASNEANAAEIRNWKDRLQVHVSAKDITTTQNKIVKNAQIGTL